MPLCGPPSNELIDKIDSLTATQRKWKLKPTLIAASLVFLLGFGMFISGKNTFGLSGLSALHNLNNFSITSNNINDLANHVGININPSHLTNFNNQGYIPHGAIKTSNHYKGDIKLVALKNNTGKKVSICYLPRSYNLPYHEKTQIKNVDIHHGEFNSQHFIFWQGNKNTIVFISPGDLPHDELINLAYNFIGDV